MSEWWTYQLSDFLLFSSQTYYRLFELYNREIWPWQPVALALGLSLVALVFFKPGWQGRAIAALLAACWLWVAWAYHLQRYATINWAAGYFAAGFAFEAALLIWTGVIRGRLRFQAISSAPGVTAAALVIYLFAWIAYPLMAPLMGRPWTQAEIFAIAPDPTAIATLSLLLLTAGRIYWLLLLIPVLWCLISGATLWAMDSAQAIIGPLAVLAVVALATQRTTSRKRGSNKQ